MATARERLLQALTAIISQPYGDEGKNALNRLPDLYRSKPEKTLIKTKPPVMRSRARYLNLGNTTKASKKNLGRIISSFRMQLKQGSAGTNY